MSLPSPPPGPDSRGLFSLFPPAEFLARSELVAPEELPEPFYGLLVHEHHMTVTVETHHGDAVDVDILEEHRGQHAYARKILLRLRESRRVVLFGAVRVHFRYCSPAVRDQIVAGKTPLGRVLIEHNVLRHVMPTAFLRVTPAPALQSWFGLTEPQPTYGRLALIQCDERPAIEVLEIVPPE